MLIEEQNCNLITISMYYETVRFKLYGRVTLQMPTLQHAAWSGRGGGD